MHWLAYAEILITAFSAVSEAFSSTGISIVTALAVASTLAVGSDQLDMWHPEITALYRPICMGYCGNDVGISVCAGDATSQHVNGRNVDTRYISPTKHLACQIAVLKSTQQQTQPRNRPLPPSFVCCDSSPIPAPFSSCPAPSWSAQTTPRSLSTSCSSSWFSISTAGVSSPAPRNADWFRL